ncbi:hypothetical protein KY285_018357 [Solanum tuberosum]|nr:hypothetical protein KY289_019261 [Solanum tuberosum]KAH0704079.1 hypothetical protein KY285_018357 [Solanum tuberosum]
MSHQKSLMHLRAILQIVVAISLLLSYAKIEARQSLSKVEDLELERQLKLINKPAIKTIKMKPILPNLHGDDTSSHINKPFNIGLKGGGCPTGTVPIRRITKDDLIRQTLSSQIRGADESPDGDGIESSVLDRTNSSTPFKGGRKFATVQIPDNSTNKITGAGAIISLHNPQNLSGHQFSAGRIKVQNGIESIQVGWIVNPYVYGDTHTRLYTYLKTEKLACFNTRCPGFIHINTAIPLDGDLPGSTYGGPIYDVPMYIALDMSNGNWWFKFGPNYTSVGFWPSKIFTKLNEFATSVEYGGIVYSPPGVSEPSMGGGYFPVGDLKKDGYCKNSTYLTDKNETKSLDDIEVKLYANSPNLYRVADYPNSGVESGNLVLYGGPVEAENLELEKQLKLLNKPAIKTIKMKPTLPNLQKDDISSNTNRPLNIGLKGGGCPTGTVPIRRISKDDLIRQRLLSQIRGADDSPDGDGIEFNVSNGTKSHTKFRGDYKFAVVKIPNNPSNQMAGAGAILSLHNPQNHSGGHIKVQNGIDSIQVGWTDMSNGNWWFKMGPNYTLVGFWPSKIFTKLNGFATSAEFGGVVYSPPGVPEPSMGGGYFPVGDMKKDGYCRKSTYLTNKNETKSLDDIEVKLFANSPNLYRILQIVVAISLLLSYAKIEARQSLSEVEDLELERQLKLINKPAIKTIKTNDGDVYDCVDFYKQPAFDHPLLQNHDFHPEMKPTLSKSRIDAKASSFERPSKIGLEGDGCPSGTVPIKRVTKEDLIRHHHMQGMDKSHRNGHGNNITNSKASFSLDDVNPYQYAETQIPSSDRNIILGGGMITTIHAPINVQKDQFSGARVRLEAGLSDAIEVGWIVHPTLNGDNKPRLYAKFEAGSAGCFNTLCSGFVLVDTDIPLGMPLVPSRIGGPVSSQLMYLEQWKLVGYARRGLQTSGILA